MSSSSQRVKKVDMRRDGHVGKGSRDNLSISWHDSLQPESEIDDAAVGGPPGGAPRGLLSLGKGATAGETNAAQWATDGSPPGTPAPLHADGLVVEDESVGGADVHPSMMRGKVVECEERLETLLEEVGTLQGEVLACGQVRSHLEDELAHISNELPTSARESARLHRSLSRTQRMSSGAVQKDGLLKKLSEAEKGEAAATEAAAMHDVMSHLTQASSPASAALTRHQEALNSQLEKFQVTAHGLQTLMQQHHGQNVEWAPLPEQQDVSLQKPTDAEEGSSQLLKRVHGLVKDINNLMTEVELEKVKVLSSEEQCCSLEANLAHLQNQLRSKEAENQQQAMQIQALKQGVELHAAEAAEHGKQLCELKEHTRKDCDGLKHTIRVQRKRVEQMEASSMSLQAQLVQKVERQMNDALMESEKWRVKHEQASKNVVQMEVETSQLKLQVHNLLEKAKAGRNRLQEKLRKTDQEHESSVVQNNSLQASLIEAEEKLACTQNELQQYTATMRQYENLVEGYKMQVFKTRTEAEESRLKMKELEKENQHLRKQTVRHCSTLAYVHRCSGSGMTYKEQFPDLQPSEQELQESTKQVLNAERRLGHLNETIAELEAKQAYKGIVKVLGRDVVIIPGSRYPQLKQREVEAESRNEHVDGLQDENHQLQLPHDTALRLSQH
uniref:outer dense fiber protein 2 n=1 Tax=Myxine glutinosa TaxID=7769 RepID=UPI00358E6985